MGGLLGGEPGPMSEMINGGEKAWFWLIFLFGIGVGITGTLLDFPDLGADPRSPCRSPTLFTPSSRPCSSAPRWAISIWEPSASRALSRAMWTGYVDAVWAEQNHDLWYEEIREQGKIPEAASPKT